MTEIYIKYIPEILELLDIELVCKSRIDDSFIIKVESDKIDIIKKYFKLSEISQLFNTPTYFKIEDFQNDKWRIILDRKGKLLKLNEID